MKLLKGHGVRKAEDHCPGWLQGTGVAPVLIPAVIRRQLCIVLWEIFAFLK